MFGKDASSTGALELATVLDAESLFAGVAVDESGVDDPVDVGVLVVVVEVGVDAFVVTALVGVGTAAFEFEEALSMFLGASLAVDDGSGLTESVFESALSSVPVFSVCKAWLFSAALGRGTGD